MKIKAVLGIILILLFIGMLTSAFNIQPAESSGTIYIRSDGSVDPTTAPIQRDGDVYTFTDNIYDSIVVEKDNVVVDGASYTVQGLGSGTGIDLSWRNTVTIENVEIKAFNNGIFSETSMYIKIIGNNITANTNGIYFRAFGGGHNITGNNITANGRGIYLSMSSGNISGNNITNNGDGIVLDYSPNNIISGNSITNNGDGITLGSSERNNITGNTITGNTNNGIYIPPDAENNKITGNIIAANNNYGINIRSVTINNIINGNNITNNNGGVFLSDRTSNKFYHNNFVNNTQQVGTYELGSPNIWDDGYPSGGNYWSDYTDVDFYSGPNQDEPGSDGIWDHHYIIDDYNLDHYPLSSPVPPDFEIVVSPSTDTAAQGTVVTTYIYVSTIAGYDHLVSLSASGQPEGVLINFNPDIERPYFRSTVTIQVGYSVPTNNYSITLIGLGTDGKTHSTTYTLTVTAEVVPEFPIELTLEILLIPVIIYILWRSKQRKKGEGQCARMLTIPKLSRLMSFFEICKERSLSM